MKWIGSFTEFYILDQQDGLALLKTLNVLIAAIYLIAGCFAKCIYIALLCTNILRFI